MTKETIVQDTHATVLQIENSAIKTVSTEDLVKNGLRIYYSGLIGVAGAIGDYDDLELEKKAMTMIKDGVSYLPEPTQDEQICMIFNYDVAHGTDFVEDMNKLLSMLRSNFPEFIFSNSIRLIDHCFKMQNNAGLFFQYQDHFLDLKLNFKHKSSQNPVDGLLCCHGRKYDQDVFMKSCHEQLLAFMNPVQLPETKKMPFIFSTQKVELFSKLIQDTNGRNVATHHSPLSGKLGHKLFNENFSFMQSHNPEKLICPFFDSEATTHPDSNYRIALIEKGVFVQAYTDKCTALEFNMPHTGSADGAFDELPYLGLRNYELLAGEQNIPELMEDQTGILVDTTEKSNFSENGDFSSVVTRSWLIKDGQKLGKLPPFQIKGSYDNMFGDDFVGISKDPLQPLTLEHGIVIKLSPLPL